MSVRIFLVLTLFMLQISSVAKADRPQSLHFLSESSQDHQHAEEPQDHLADSEFAHDHEDYHDSDDLAAHEHKHRHSPDEPEHSHSHQHVSGQLPLTCLAPVVSLQLNLHLNAKFKFPRLNDRAIQSPDLSSVFRPPIFC